MTIGKAQYGDILDVGIDWLTITSGVEDSNHETVLSLWYWVFEQAVADADLSEAATMLGYSGRKTDGAFIGTRHDGAMLRLSGKVAKRYALEVNVAGCTLTRLDLQVTIRWTGDGANPPVRAALHAKGANRFLPTSRQRNVEEHTDDKGGHTTYIGSRQSTSFARVYHKSAQDPEAYGQDVYRYEVQFNKGPATQVFEALRSSPKAPYSVIKGLVWTWFHQRGVLPLFDHAGQVVNVSRETIPLTDLDKKLAWLYNQVRPTVERLNEQGHIKDVLIALLGRDTGRAVYNVIVTPHDASEDDTTAPETTFAGE